MLANYVVALVKGIITPFIVFPDDPKGLNRPLEALGYDFDFNRDVVSAGVLTWTGGADATVTCEGQGEVVVNYLPRKSITVQSRGQEDAQLFKEMLSRPIGYMVLRFSGTYHPVFLRDGDTHDWHLLAQFQIRPHKVVEGAGWIDFGLSTGNEPVCFGEAVFDKNERARVDRSVLKQSRGQVDLAIIEQAYVKPAGPRQSRGIVNPLATL